MTKLSDSINDIAIGLHKADIIDKKTLRELTDDDLPSLVEYTGEEIRQLRMRQKLSQAVFAKYLNVSPAMIRSLEHGKRHARGAILKLLNIIDKHGFKALA